MQDQFEVEEVVKIQLRGNGLNFFSEKFAGNSTWFRTRLAFFHELLGFFHFSLNLSGQGLGVNLWVSLNP